MCQIPTGRPLTSSYVWHFFFLIPSVTNEAFTAERRWRDSALVSFPHKSAASHPLEISKVPVLLRHRRFGCSPMPLWFRLQAAKANLEMAQSALAGSSDEAARAEVQISIEANEAIIKALE